LSREEVAVILFEETTFGSFKLLAEKVVYIPHQTVMGAIEVAFHAELDAGPELFRGPGA